MIIINQIETAIAIHIPLHYINGMGQRGTAGLYCRGALEGNAVAQAQAGKYKGWLRYATYYQLPAGIGLAAVFTHYLQGYIVKIRVQVSMYGVFATGCIGVVAGSIGIIIKVPRPIHNSRQYGIVGAGSYNSRVAGTVASIVAKSNGRVLAYNGRYTVIGYRCRMNAYGLGHARVAQAAVLTGDKFNIHLTITTGCRHLGQVDKAGTIAIVNQAGIAEAVGAELRGDAHRKIAVAGAAFKLDGCLIHTKFQFGGCLDGG